jgi:putative nucleotidyltransferase with HDIG domain
MGAHMRLSREELTEIRTAALLHDVGKLYTPREVLHKPGRLTDEEFDVIKRHPTDGARLVKLLLGDEQLASIVLHHHERIDGTGYPCSLTGELIPLGARIIAVADTFDAITSRRPYRPAMPHKAALDILRREAGAQLDPAAVRAFMAVYRARRSHGALAAFSGVAEGAIPSLTGSGATLAGIAAGAAALGGGGLAFRQAQKQHKPAVASAHPHRPLAGAGTRLFAGVATTTGRNSRQRSRPGTRSGARPPASLPTDPRPKPGGSGTGAPGRPVGSVGGTSGTATYGGTGAPSSHGGGSSGGGSSGGGANPVTVTTSGSGAGVTVGGGGATATVGSTVSTSTTNPGAGVNVAAGGGGAGAGINASGSGSGGASAGVTVTAPGLPPTTVTTPSTGAIP